MSKEIRAERCHSKKPKLSCCYTPKKIWFIKIYHIKAAIWCADCKRQQVYVKFTLFKPDLNKVVEKLIKQWNRKF